jgi:hypothetical protein
MIPQEKSAAVTRGLREAFGVTVFEDIRKLTKGHTSNSCFPHRRAGISVPVADNHAHRRSHVPLHMHEGGS